MNAPDHRELDWLACRYILGEMTAEESVAWEERLSTDQAAREAVAAAVELVQMLDAAKRLGARTGASGAPMFDSAAATAAASDNSTAVTRPTRVTPNRVRLITAVSGLATVAAALFLAVHMQWFSGPSQSSERGESAGRSGELASELARHWSQTRQSQNDPQDDLVGTEDASAEDSDGSFTGEADPNAVDRAWPSTPSWLTAAMQVLDGSDAQKPDDSDEGAREL